MEMNTAWRFSSRVVWGSVVAALHSILRLDMEIKYQGKGKERKGKSEPLRLSSPRRRRAFDDTPTCCRSLHKHLEGTALPWFMHSGPALGEPSVSQVMWKSPPAGRPAFFLTFHLQTPTTDKRFVALTDCSRVDNYIFLHKICIRRLPDLQKSRCSPQSTSIHDKVLQISTIGSSLSIIHPVRIHIYLQSS